MKNIRNLTIVCAIVLGLTSMTYNDRLFEISKNLEIFISAYKELNQNFADDLDPGILMRKAIDAMTTSLDPYTNYLSESQIESYWLNDDDKYTGLGAEMEFVDGSLTVTESYEGGPAFTAGLKPGDKVLSIEGQQVEGRKKNDIKNILRGFAGTSLNLLVMPNGQKEPKKIVITRGQVEVSNVPHKGIISGDVGYISLTTFSPNASQNIENAIKDFKKDNPNLSGIILDLRQNGGGLLHEAVNICNLFVPQGEVVVTTKGKIKEKDQVYKTLRSSLDLETPVAVLIDKRSASASEIVSGVIQDMDRGVIVGQRSFGKGLVQNTKTLPYNSSLKLTISKYYIPSGRCIQGVEYEDGTPKDIPDHLRSKFKTKNGREVLDGGGVTPDVKTDGIKKAPTVQALLDQYFIFKYVNNFVLNNDSIDNIEKFTFTAWKDFENYLNKNNFNYTTDAEKHLNSLKTSLQDIDIKDKVSELSTIEKTIQNQKIQDITKYKKEITKEIEKEIIGRYYHQKGKIQYSLDKDADVLTAVSILKDQAKYKKLLNKI